jgi:chromosome partitioning protein
MIVTVASFKGGVGKTTTAIHLAAFFQGYAETLLIDADPNRSALSWAERGDLPFPVVDQWQARAALRPYGYVVIDTQARPTANDLGQLVSSCDLLVIPTTPDILALEALVLTVNCSANMNNPDLSDSVDDHSPKTQQGRKRRQGGAKAKGVTHF